MTTEEIISCYHHTESIKETARIADLSVQKVRRILITAKEATSSTVGGVRASRAAPARLALAHALALALALSLALSRFSVFETLGFSWVSFGF